MLPEQEEAVIQKIFLTSSSLCALLFAMPAMAQEVIVKKLIVCETAAEARNFVEMMHDPKLSARGRSGGCVLRAAEYQRGPTVDSLARDGVFYKIVEVTLTKSYDDRPCPPGLRYSIVYPIEFPPIS